MELAPLFDFFCDLQEYDRKSLGREPLTLDEYGIVVEALVLGVGLFSENDLRDLCRLAWRKPYHDPSVFDELFERYRMSVRARGAQAAPMPPTPPPAPLDPPAPPTNNQDSTTNNNKTEGGNTPQNQSGTTETRTQGTMSVTDKWLSLPMMTETISGIPGSSAPVADIYSPMYAIDNRFLPGDLTPRRVRQLLLSVRRRTPDRFQRYVDWPSTIRLAARKGFLLEPIWRRKMNFYSGLTFLVDCSPSMVAFDDFTKNLETLMARDIEGEGSIFYFMNCPGEYLYGDRDQVSAHPLPEWIASGRRQVIVLSDAGAARGYPNIERADATLRFLDLMRRHQIVWINPMPKRRWAGNAAEMVARKVRMFEGNDAGLVAAIRYLKSKNG